MLDHIRWPLAVKLILITTISIIVAVTGVTLVSIWREQQSFQTELLHQAELTLAALAIASGDSLYRLDVERLSGMAELSNETQSVATTRFYNAEGRVIADPLTPELSRRFELDPFGQRLVSSDITIFEWQPDYLLAGQRVKVGSETLGAVSVTLTTTPLTAKVARVRNQGIAVALVGVLIGTLLALLLSRSIINPLQELMRAVKRLAGGDLTQEIAVTSRDELAILAAAMEQMRAELQALYLDLEQQVAERTTQLSATNEQLMKEIIERQFTESALIQARDQALEASRFKSELLANVSHELRTPLGVIVGYAEMLQEEIYGPIAGEQRDLLKYIIESSQYLTRQVNELLDQARLQNGKIELQITTFALADIIDKVYHQMQVLAQAKGLTLTLEVAAEMPATLSGDPARLQQVLVNLMSNALKFTSEGSIQTCIYRLEHNHWGIQVSDTGPGIPKEAQAYIFEPFRQLDGSITRKHGGTGLGLSIVKQLVTLMEGEIFLRSEVGRGSTFTVELPLISIPEEID